MRRIEPDLDRDAFVPTLYRTEHHIEQSEEQISRLIDQIAAARGHVYSMKNRDSSTPPAPATPLSLRQKIVRDYHRIADTGWTVMFYIALAFCAVILAVGIYSMLDSFGDQQ